MVDIQLNKLEQQQARLNEIAEALTEPVAVPLANLALFAH